jgi:uncharacterized membrane protein
LMVMGLIAVINFAVGAAFYLIGAWPVMGFCGLDVALIWWAFRRNFADARRLERIEITEHELVLERLAANRQPEVTRFVRPWIRVELEEDKERELVGRLLLRSRGSATEIGSFLGAEERVSLAGALRAQLFGS